MKKIYMAPVLVASLCLAVVSCQSLDKRKKAQQKIMDSYRTTVMHTVSDADRERARSSRSKPPICSLNTKLI